MSTSEILAFDIEKEPEVADSSSHVQQSLIQCLRRLAIDSLANAFYIITFSVITGIDILYISHFIEHSEVNDAVGGVSVAKAWIGVIADFIIYSFNHGTSVLAAQAYGTHNYELVGLYLHRAFVLRTIILIPSINLLFFSDRILYSMGVAPEVADYGGYYCRVIIFGVVLRTINDTLKSHLLAHNIFKPLGYIQVVGMLTHLLFCDIFVRQCQVGFIGIAYAFIIFQVVILLCYIGYLMKWNPNPQTLFWPNKKCLLNLWTQFRMEVQFAIFIYLEYVVYEIMVFFAALIGKIELEAVAITFSFALIIFDMGVGIGSTLTTIIAHYMGENNVPQVKMYIRAAAILGPLAVVFATVPVFIFAESIIGWYTDTPSVVSLGTKVLRIYSVYYIMDMGQALVVSVIKGVGKEEAGSKVYFFCFFVCGIFCAYAFGFWFGLGAAGLMYGMAVGLTLMFIVGLIIIRNTDLAKQAIFICERQPETSTTENSLSTTI